MQVRYSMWSIIFNGTEVDAMALRRLPDGNIAAADQDYASPCPPKGEIQLNNGKAFVNLANQI
jgi:hypothetical protein